MQVRAADEIPNALAAMLIERLTASPDRTWRRTTRVRLRALDIGLAATVELGPEGAAVANGGAKAQVKVRGDAASLLALADAPTLLGVPNPLTAAGRGALGSLGRGVRIRGAWRHPLVLLRFTRALGAPA